MKALILGIGGMDGSYLADHLLSLGYEVHGLVRRASTDNLTRIHHILDKVHLHKGDLCDGASVHRILQEVRPEEIYNLADQDHVGTSFEAPDYNMDVTCAAVGRLLESVRLVCPRAKVFQACSATMFGMQAPPQSEETPHDPRSPYAVAKTGAYHLVRFYRQHYGLAVSNGILFNHDGPRRGEDYLLHRVVRGCLRIHGGNSGTKIHLANLDLRVDVGSAQEFVIGFHKILQLATPTDVCIGTGFSPSIEQIVLQTADMVWGDKQRPHLRDLVEELPSSQEKPYLKANCAKLRRLTGWWPDKVTGKVIEELVEHYRG
jgi:GDPmannose 4,6-dehydratase